jgi:hypothetical protein
MKQKRILKISLLFVMVFLLSYRGKSQTFTYPIVETNQTQFFDNNGEITEPLQGDDFYGQDANFTGTMPNYTDNGDGTITDNNTGLMWIKERGSKMSWNDAVAGANSNNTGGYNDWRMPTIKELYSLILFSGKNGYDVFSTEGYVPFIDTTYFEFEYGSGIGDERVIDCQDWSGTEYVSTTQQNQPTIFGVNFADGRLKGYKKYLPPTWTEYNELFVRYVRGNELYGINSFVDNIDGTITDSATGLMWSKDDSQQGLNWLEALDWVQEKNNVNYLGHNDWRMPNIKELQSIVDYTRSPEETSSPAVDINYFNCSSITNEAEELDYPYFWSGTVLLDGPTFDGCYIPFGRAMCYLYNEWQDVHGAGSQKSDIMIGDPANFPYGRGPQGDAVRIYNYVRLVRTVETSAGFNDIKSRSHIKIYPNPITDFCNISMNEEHNQIKISIYNTIGTKLKEFNYINIKAVELNLTDIPKGLYLINISLDNNAATSRFIKM